MNLYKTQTLLKAVQNMPKTNTFLRDTFFPVTKPFVTEEVLLDIKKGKRKMAPFVAPRVGGVTIARQGYHTEKFKAPRLAPQIPMTIDDVSMRMAGEDVFSQKTPQQRQQEMLAGDLLELVDMIDRREEWMATQTLFEGKVLLEGYTGRTDTNKVEQEINYDFENKITLSGTDLWTHADSDIYSDLEDARKLAIRKSGIAPDVAILGAKAYKALRDNVKFKELMDLANMKIATIEPALKNDAITYIGKVPGLGIELYTYDDWYISDSGEELPFVPENKVLLAKKGFGMFGYGAISHMDKEGKVTTYEARMVPKQWVDVENEILMIRMSSRPVPMPGDINSWVVLEVVV